MKTKPKDIPYCGVREQKIAALSLESVNAEALDTFIHMIAERYKIHLRKDVKQTGPPYTKDAILKEFRFTNVRREHDKETKWVIQHITSNRSLSYEDKLLNCILFRLFNKHETAKLLGMPIEFIKFYDPEVYRFAFAKQKKLQPSYVFFTGAFNTGGLKRALKWYLPEGRADSMEMRVMYFMQYLMDQGVTHYLTSKDAESPEAVCELLQSYMGIGEFLAYQMFVDMTYIDKFPFSENEFTIAGPGAKMGLKYLFHDTGGCTAEELIFWLRDNWKDLNQYNTQSGGKHTLNPQKLFQDLPEEDRVMNVMSLENCLCEFSKYWRVKNNLGRPRQKYKPKTERRSRGTDT